MLFPAPFASSWATGGRSPPSQRSFGVRPASIVAPTSCPAARRSESRWRGCLPTTSTATTTWWCSTSRQTISTSKRLNGSSRLVKMNSALVLVTHDRHTLDRLTTAVGPSKVVELDGGRCFRPPGRRPVRAPVRDLPRRPSGAHRPPKCRKSRPAKSSLAKELAWLRGETCRSTKPKARLPSPTNSVRWPGAGRCARQRPAARWRHRWSSAIRSSNSRASPSSSNSGRPRQADHLRACRLAHRTECRLAVVRRTVGKSTLFDIIAARTEPADERG